MTRQEREAKKSKERKTVICVIGGLILLTGGALYMARPQDIPKPSTSVVKTTTTTMVMACPPPKVVIIKEKPVVTTTTTVHINNMPKTD